MRTHLWHSKRTSHQLFAFFVVTSYQACTCDHSSTLLREVPYLLHTHYMLLPDII